MICSTCIIAKPLSLCEGQYVIGIIEDVLTEVKVRIRNIVTGRIDYVTVTSDDVGKVSIIYNPMQHTYEIQVVSITDGTPYILTTTDPDGMSAECIRVSFEVSHLTSVVQR